MKRGRQGDEVESESVRSVNRGRGCWCKESSINRGDEKTEDASKWLEKAIGDLVRNEGHELDLEYNVQYPSKAMAEALKVNLALQVLRVRYHHISDEDLKELSETLKVNSARQVLDLE